MIFNMTAGAGAGARATGGETVLLASFSEPDVKTIDTPLTDYTSIYVEIMLSGLSVSSRLIPVSRVLYGRRFNVSFNNDLTFYNAQVGFSDANTVSCGILQSADSMVVYGVK